MLKQNVIGGEVRGHRRRLALKQDALAARLTLLGWNCSENLISKIESGHRRVIDRELYLIARALGVTTDSLFPGGKLPEGDPRWRVPAP